MCWAVILGLALICSIGHLYLLTSAYLRYEYHTIIEVKPDVKLTFPEVTVCDTVGLSHYALNNYEGTKTLFKRFHVVLKGFLKQNNHTLLHDKETLAFLAKWLRAPAFIFANVPSEDRSKIGSQFDSLVTDCLFAEMPWDQSNFEVFMNSKYSVCYTFKADTVSSKCKPFVGEENGLSLILRGETSLTMRYNVYVKGDNTKGIQTHVHPSNTIPFVSNSGFGIFPGVSTSMEVTEKEYIRLGDPYSKCQPNQNVNILSKEYLMEPNFCLHKCMIDFLFEGCKCISTTMGGVAEDHRQHCLYIEPSEDSFVNVPRVMCVIDTLYWFINNET